MPPPNAKGQLSKFEIKSPDGGLYTKKPAHAIDDSQSPDAQNFDPSEVGRIKKRLGHIKFTALAKVTPTGTFISGLFAGATSAGTVYVLAAEGTTVQNIAAGTWAAAITGLTITVDTPVDMGMFNDKMIICNQGGGPFFTTNGTSASALAGSPPANSRYMMVHRNRVFLAPGTSSVVTHSALLDESDYTTVDNAGSLTFSKGDGMVINGMCSGQDFAIISKVSPASGGKDGKLYILYGSSPFDWTVRKIADVGALSHKAMVAYDNFVAIATPRGIYGVQGKYPFKLSDSIDPDWSAIPNKGTVTAGRYMTKLYFSYPASGSANNREFVIDVEHGKWARNSGKTPRYYASHPDGRLLFGTSGTTILVWEAENGSGDDGSAIDFHYDTPDMFFDTQWSPSQVVAAYIQAKTTPSATITVTHYVDGTADAFSDTMAVATEGPVKKLKGFIETRGTMHRLRLRDNSQSGQTEIYSIKVEARPFQDGTQISR